MRRGGPAMRWIRWMVVLAALLWVCRASVVHAGNNVWTSSGPEGGFVFALAIAPSPSTTLYAGTAGGVFKSTNGGSSWNAVNAGLVFSLPNTAVFALALDPTTPTTLYAGTSNSGI